MRSLRSELIRRVGREDADWLLCEALGCKRAELPLALAPCAPALRERLLTMAVRRASGEPLQYVLGWTPFCGLRIACDARALIPRPETEEMAALACDLATKHGFTAALDLGTGTGALALALAAAGLEVTAIDLSPEALALARENARANGLTARFLQGGWYDPLPQEARFALIVSNPPYIPSADIAGLEAHVRDREPRLALDGGPDGLDAYRAILSQDRLLPGGYMLLEVGFDQAEAVARMAVAAGFGEIGIINDMYGARRFVRIRSRHV